MFFLSVDNFVYESDLVGKVDYLEDNTGYHYLFCCNNIIVHNLYLSCGVRQQTLSHNL